MEGDGNTFCYGNSPGSKCDIMCPHGYEIVGDSQAVCGEDGVWKGKSSCRCRSNNLLQEKQNVSNRSVINYALPMPKLPAWIVLLSLAQCAL